MYSVLCFVCFFVLSLAVMCIFLGFFFLYVVMASVYELPGSGPLHPDPCFCEVKIRIEKLE
jgi:hypothetical protein